MNLATSRVGEPSTLRIAVVCAASDPDSRVRCQVAIAAGQLEASAAAELLAAMLRRDGADPWLTSAALSSANRCCVELLVQVADDGRFAAKPFRDSLLARLAGVVGAKADRTELARVFERLAGGPSDKSKAIVLAGIGQALQNGPLSFDRLWDTPPPELGPPVLGLRPLFEHFAALAGDASQPLTDRLVSARALAYGPFSLAAGPLTQMFDPQNPPELQTIALKSLAAHSSR